MATENMPRHVAIIMDGNGRWATRKGLPRTAGHKAAVGTVREIVGLSAKWGIEALTLYAFSTENWKRPAEEVSVLMGLLIEVIKNEVPKIHKNNVCLRVIGRKDNLPENVKTAIDGAVKLTKNNTGLKLNIAFNYGGRDEIVRAAKAIAKDVSEGRLKEDEVTESLVSSYLDTAGLPDPDLVIRTSGELRISNFLLYQSAYSEYYFPEVMFPDFKEEEYKKALEFYGTRSRRFGKV